MSLQVKLQLGIWTANINEQTWNKMTDSQQLRSNDTKSEETMSTSNVRWKYMYNKYFTCCNDIDCIDSGEYGQDYKNVT